MPQSDEKLEMFQRSILEKANAQGAQIRQETEELVKAEMEKEEARILEGFYNETQGKIAKVKTEYTKEYGRVRAQLKKELYAQREQYLSEMLARVRAELCSFVQSTYYPLFLEKKADVLCRQWKNGTLRIRPEDMQFKYLLEGLGHKVETDDAIQIGGMILVDADSGVIIDESLDNALEGQRDWFQRNSGFQAEGGH